MRVLAISGSARKGGNTATLLRRVLAVLEERGIETEIIELAGKRAQGCTACLKCRETLDHRCHGRNDAINECIEKADAADGLLIGSPVYFGDVSAETKALIDRLGYVGRANKGMMDRKVGAGVVAVRRAGALHALDTIHHGMHLLQMVVPGSSYWAFGMGGPIGAVEEDAEGLDAMDALGANIAWLLECTASSR